MSIQKYLADPIAEVIMQITKCIMQINKNKVLLGKILCAIEY